MQYPFLFHVGPGEGTTCTLDETASRHAIQVLRMQQGDKILLTNGEGTLWTTFIADAHKKHCVVNIEKTEQIDRPQPREVCIAISPIKNTGRLEWFIEKATELGVAEIRLLQCHRTEKQHLRFERLLNISISALLQSRQVWLPRLVPHQGFAKVMEQTDFTSRFIAHCENGNKTDLKDIVNKELKNCIMLIGPEGDFTPEEIDMALAAGYSPVSLGNTRLRTETAGIVAAGFLCVG